jgi:hypothetical protein
MFVSATLELGPISDQDLAWLAGLIEGEGTFLAGPPSAPRMPAVQVTMIDRDVIERAGSLFEVGVQLIPSRRDNWRDAYAVRVRGARAVLWMKRLRPLMGSRRQKQIDRAMASYAPDPRRVMDDTQAAAALQALARGESVKDVATRFGTSIWSIYDLRLGRTYAHLPRPG